MQNNSLNANENSENAILEESKLCPKCKNALTVNDTFCSNCGHELPSERFFSLKFFKEYSNLFIVSFITIIGWGILNLLIDFIESYLLTNNPKLINNPYVNYLNSIPLLFTIVFSYIYFMKSKLSIPKSLFKKILIYEFCIIILSINIIGLLGDFISKTNFYVFSGPNLFVMWIYGFIFTFIFGFLIEMKVNYAKK